MTTVTDRAASESTKSPIDFIEDNVRPRRLTGHRAAVTTCRGEDLQGPSMSQTRGAFCDEAPARALSTDERNVAKTARETASSRLDGGYAVETGPPRGYRVCVCLSVFLPGNALRAVMERQISPANVSVQGGPTRTAACPIKGYVTSQHACVSAK